MCRMTHSAYIEITVPHEDGTSHETATSAEFASAVEAGTWVKRNLEVFAADGVVVTLMRVEPMPEPASVREVVQDGRYFFTPEEGRTLYVVGPEVVRDDYDTAGAQRARAMFLTEFPNAEFGGEL